MYRTYGGCICEIICIGFSASFKHVHACFSESVMKLEDLGEIYNVDMRIRVCETHRRQEPEFRIELGTMECETSVVPWYQWVIVI